MMKTGLILTLRILLMAAVLTHAEASFGQLIVAHRGASYTAPENTLAAFREAWNQSADAIEGDFCLTKDGHIVCIHDKTTSRVTSGTTNLVVEEALLEDLRQLDVGAWKNGRFAGEKIPLLEEVLATVPASGRIFVELKTGESIVEPLRVILERCNLRAEQIVIISFDEEVIRQCRRVMPQYHANWLTAYKTKADNKAAQNELVDDSVWQPSLAKVLQILKETGASGLGTHANDEVVDAKFVEAIRSAGFEPHVWTINDPSQAQRYHRLGFQSITTDRPAYLREQLRGGANSDTGK